MSKQVGSPRARQAMGKSVVKAGRVGARPRGRSPGTGEPRSGMGRTEGRRDLVPGAIAPPCALPL
jgi:hypothetical protein